MKRKTTSDQAKISIPDIAVKELEQVEHMGLEFSMEKLVSWVNEAVERFLPQANESGDKRVSSSFTVRTLRHYQTLGCLDAPHKDGRRAIYSFRHYLQALLIRKLLYLSCPPESIRASLEGKDNGQYKEMLFGDLEITSSAPALAAPPQKKERLSHFALVTGSQTWTRIPLGSGAELHLEGPPENLTAARRKELLRQIENHLQG